MHTGLKRRHCLAGLAALGSFGSRFPAIAEMLPQGRSALTVIDAQMLQLSGNDKRKSLYLKLLTDSGIEGLYGPIDEEAAVMTDRFFSTRVIGQDAFAVDAFWDRMFLASRHSRGSHYLMGLSAVDNALWDLRGKALGLPVYRLLGGSRNKLRAYASTLGLPKKTEDIQPIARRLKEEGYRHQKWFVTKRGPKFGPEGVAADALVVQLTREAVGDDVDLMFDALWKWNLQYALDWTRRVEQYRPRWLEEPLLTANLDALTQLSRSTSIPIAMGEHFYGRWDVHNFLKADVINVVQADPEWCGGVSELTKMCILASVYGATVIPHGHSLHAAMHVVASQPEEVCPLVEYLINKMTGPYYYFEKDVPAPVNGILTMNDRPGFGILLDDSRITDIRQVHWNLG
jgi:L-alanine-DL-glutamate epimerase-like enolase superfamily enzyme